MWVAGTRTAGVVERIGKTRVESHFTHFNLLPLTSRGSYLVLDDGQVVPIARHRASILAAYARGWGWALSIATFVGAAYLHPPWQGPTFVLSFLVFAAWLATFRIGAISAEETRRRSVYAKVTGYPVDPALLTEVNPSLTEHLAVDLATRAEASAPDGYRGRTRDWRAACESPGVDASFLAIALTLTRIGAGRGDASDQQLHARIWSRLAAMANDLPARVEPMTEIARAADAAPPASSPASPAEWESVPGHALEAGWDVTISSSAAIDPRCASCLADTERTLQSTMLGIFSGKRVAIPLCDRCIRHSYRADHGRSSIIATGVVVALVWGFLGVVKQMSWPVVAILVFFLAMVSVAFIPFLAPPRRAAAPAHIARTAARLVRARGGTMTLHCLNEEWARSVAERAGTTAHPKKRLFRGAIGALFLAPFFAPLIGVLTHDLAHPKLRVDNGTGAPIRVYVDGEDEGVIQPTRPDRPATKLEMSWGEHTLEWASTQSPEKRHKTAATIEFNGHHLWDPGATHCYRVVATVYGKNTVDESNTGPRPRTELYTFSQLQDWFVDSPEKVETNASGTVRYSLQRDATCTSVGRCGEAAVNKYWDCMLSGGDVGNCGEVATELCDE